MLHYKTSFNLTFEPSDHGCADVIFSVQAQQIKINLSYLWGDPLPDLAKALILLQNGSLDPHDVIFAEEPNAYLLRLRPSRWQGSIHYELYTIPDVTKYDKEKGVNVSQIILSNVADLEVLLNRIHDLMVGIKEKFGEEDYLERWWHPFPAEEMIKLSPALD